ncbi:MAG TPA: protoporphyrinogen oxidase, partial [Cyclobacteriaceae bacterium]
NPILNGIYAGDSEALSISSTLPLVKRLAKEHGSVIKGLRKEKDKLKMGRMIISMKGGFSKLIESLQENLDGQLHLSAEVTAIKINDGKSTITVKEVNDEKHLTFDKVFLTVPAFASAALLKNVNTEIADQLGKIKYTNVSQIYCEVELSNEKTFDGFGFLVPAEERLSLLGAICISNIFPHKAPEGKKLFALFCGGDRPYPFEARVEEAIKEFNSILKPTTIHMLRVQEWNNAIPQFHVGHQAVLQQLQSFESKNPAIVFAGNYVSGVSLGDCVEYATKF